MKMFPLHLCWSYKLDVFFGACAEEEVSACETTFVHACTVYLERILSHLDLVYTIYEFHCGFVHWLYDKQLHFQFCRMHTTHAFCYVKHLDTSHSK